MNTLRVDGKIECRSLKFTKIIAPIKLLEFDNRSTFERFVRESKIATKDMANICKNFSLIPIEIHTQCGVKNGD